jgi:hypothetical protein
MAIEMRRCSSSSLSPLSVPTVDPDMSTNVVVTPEASAATRVKYRNVPLYNFISSQRPGQQWLWTRNRPIDIADTDDVVSLANYTLHDSCGSRAPAGEGKSLRRLGDRSMVSAWKLEGGEERFEGETIRIE